MLIVKILLTSHFATLDIKFFDFLSFSLVIGELRKLGSVSYRGLSRTTLIYKMQYRNIKKGD